jgi:Co/Zn/Cd efflux system component
VLAAFANSILLVFIAGMVLLEAITRFEAPPKVRSNGSLTAL